METGTLLAKKTGRYLESEWFILVGKHPLTGERVPWAIPIRLQFVFDELSYFTRYRIYNDLLEWAMVMGRYTDALQDLRMVKMPKDPHKLQKIILGKYDNYLLRLSWDPSIEIQG